MNEFILIFRNVVNPDFNPSPEQMQEVTNQWMNWIGGIAAQNKLADRGNRLSIADARVVKPNNVVTDGPYSEIKEFINGYTIVKTATLEEAVELAKGCPILKVGGNVEVRTISPIDVNR